MSSIVRSAPALGAVPPVGDTASPDRSARPTPSGRAAPLPPEERRAAIIEAALPLLRRLGSDVTTRQIAEAAGIAEGTIFRVFTDKDSLIRAAVEAVFEPEPTLSALRDIDPDLGLQERMEAVVEIIRRRLNDVWELLGALRVFGPPDKNAGHRHMPEVVSRNELLDEAIRVALVPVAGELRLDPAQSARLLRLFVFTGAHPRITDENPLTTKEIVAVLLDGIRAHAP